MKSLLATARSASFGRGWSRLRVVARVESCDSDEASELRADSRAACLRRSSSNIDVIPESLGGAARFSLAALFRLPGPPRLLGVDSSRGGGGSGGGGGGGGGAGAGDGGEAGGDGAGGGGRGSGSGGGGGGGGGAGGVGRVLMLLSACSVHLLEAGVALDATGPSKVERGGSTEAPTNPSRGGGSDAPESDLRFASANPTATTRTPKILTSAPTRSPISGGVLRGGASTAR